MYKRIDHIALHVGDLDRSVAFYEGHFGFKNSCRR
jgi:catechol 2,3-dioxygenase-like lactoylglutathione lyase family enzyme